MRIRTFFAVASSLVLLITALGTVPAVAATGSLVHITRGASVTPVTGAYVPSGPHDVTKVEFPGQEDEANGPGPFPGFIVNRSLSRGSGSGAPVTSGKKAKSNPKFNAGFEGLNFFQQRFARGGNQFSVEPPDQGMCVGNGYVVEAVNDVFNVYDTSGNSLLPANNVGGAVDLNSFYGYPPAINRSTGVRGQFVTDPSCIYDAATQRFFLVVLTLEVNPTTGGFTGQNHLDLAVTQTGDPTGGWNIYSLDVTNDGTNTGGTNPGPYLGDYPHIGADANGVYLTTNAYPWCCNGFAGAQIYGFSKAQLAAGSSTINGVHIDTSGMVNAPSDAGPTQPGFTVWPAFSPGSSSFNKSNGGTEYFLSSNAADEATHPKAGTGGNYTSSQLVVWTMSNTSALNSNPQAVSLSNKLLGVEQYAIPPKQMQPGSGTPPGVDVPQGYCLNWPECATAILLGAPDPFTEVISTPDSNDTRMQEVTYANGKLWGALDTAVNPDGGGQRAGIAWFIINPSTPKVVMQGYLGSTGYDFTYPAIGVTASGRGVMAFTASGDSLNPSAGYAAIDALVGVSTWNVVPGGEGAAVDDGFTSYKAQVGNPPRTRWGDYGYAMADGNSVWLASEYIASACNIGQWLASPLGRCGNTRGALGNWSTYLSKFTP